MMGDKLKRCPNCGEKPPAVRAQGGTVVCDPVDGGCGMSVYDQVDMFRDAAAARLWNCAARKAKAKRPRRKAVEAAVGELQLAYLVSQIEPWVENSRERAAAARADLLALFGYGPKGGDA